MFATSIVRYFNSNSIHLMPLIISIADFVRFPNAPEVIDVHSRR